MFLSRWDIFEKVANHFFCLRDWKKYPIWSVYKQLYGEKQLNVNQYLLSSPAKIFRGPKKGEFLQKFIRRVGSITWEMVFIYKFLLFYYVTFIIAILLYNNLILCTAFHPFHFCLSKKKISFFRSIRTICLLKHSWFFFIFSKLLTWVILCQNWYLIFRVII